MAEPYRMFTSKVVPLDAENVDTDQIVPARYLKVTDKDGLAEALFRDWRFEEDGSLKDPPFILDQPAMTGRQIMLVGDNFGAGSSREHAPWALTSWGVRAILSTSYADIFRNKEMSGIGKAAWLIFVVLAPWLGVLVYLLAHGSDMAGRDIQQHQAQQAAFDSYVQSAAGGASTPAEELSKLADLHDRGVLTDAEIDDVAFKEDWNAGQFDEPDADLRGDQL